MCVFEIMFVTVGGEGEVNSFLVGGFAGRFDPIQVALLQHQSTVKTCPCIAAILQAKKEQIDLAYIQEWATRLGLSSLWKELLNSAE